MASKSIDSKDSRFLTQVENWREQVTAGPFALADQLAEASAALGDLANVPAHVDIQLSPIRDRLTLLALAAASLAPEGQPTALSRVHLDAVDARAERRRA